MNLEADGLHKQMTPAGAALLRTENRGYNSHKIRKQKTGKMLPGLLRRTDSRFGIAVNNM